MKGVSIVGYCIFAQNVPSAPNVAHVKLLADLVPPGCKSKGSVHIEGRVHPPIQTQTSTGERSVDNQWVCKPLQEPLPEGRFAFFNRLFIVPKPNQKWRPILDLSALNKFLSVKTFKMETPETIRISLQQGEWVTSLNFSDAYFHIPVHTRSRKILRFHFQTRHTSSGLFPLASQQLLWSSLVWSKRSS